jgi:hypothetical protein
MRRSGQYERGEKNRKVIFRCHRVCIGARADAARMNQIAADNLSRPGESKIVFDHSGGPDRNLACIG